MSDDEFSADSSKSSSGSDEEETSDSEGSASTTRAEEDRFLCFACGKEPKYRCPGCGRRSCSLPCVKTHKEKTGCNGQRDKTAFVSVAEFTDSHLRSDYNMLEEIGQCVDSAKRLLAHIGSNSRPPRTKAGNLMSLARRHGVRLRVLPRGMTRRADNMSSINHKLKVITWHVEWHFPNADGVVFKDRVEESVKLSDALDKYLDAEKADPAHRCRLRPYCKAGESAAAQLYMHAEQEPANDPGFYPLDSSQTLADNLRGKYIIEFPIISAVLPGYEDKYRVVQPETVNRTASSDKTVTTAEQSPLDDLYGVERGNSCADEGLQVRRNTQRGRFSRQGFGRGRHQPNAEEIKQGGRGRFRGGSRGRGRGFRHGNRPQHGNKYEARAERRSVGSSETSIYENASSGVHLASMANAATMYNSWWTGSQMKTDQTRSTPNAGLWQWTSQCGPHGENAGASACPPDAAGQQKPSVSSWQQSVPPANLAWYNFV